MIFKLKLIFFLFKKDIFYKNYDGKKAFKMLQTGNFAMN